MSADAERARIPERPAAPPRPVVPPRPAVPPRQNVPPVPEHPPLPSSFAGASTRAASGPGGEPTQEDEPTPQMPHHTDADDYRLVPPPGSARPQPSQPTAPQQQIPQQPQPAPPRIHPPQGAALPPYSPTGRYDYPGGYGAATSAPPPVPVPGRRRPAGRTVAAAVCLVLGVGLLGGAGAGAALGGGSEQSAADAEFDRIRSMWHTAEVDALFPPVMKGGSAGPGGSDRRWIRVAVAPDSDCTHAFDPKLTEAFAPAGCRRLVRATYADETTSSVTTVGLLFTRGDDTKMRALRKRFATENLTERTDLMPRPYAARGTVAAEFGDAQRASWTVRVLADAPVVVYAVTGFADGRTVSDPQPATEATDRGEMSAAAQAGLGHDAQGIADRVERALRQESEAATAEDGE